MDSEVVEETHCIYIATFPVTEKNGARRMRYSAKFIALPGEKTISGSIDLLPWSVWKGNKI